MTEDGALEPTELHLIGGTLPLISAATGRIVDSGTSVAPDRWRLQTGEPTASGACPRTLADLEIEAIVEIAPVAAPEARAAGTGIPVVRAGSAAGNIGNVDRLTG